MTGTLRLTTEPVVEPCPLEDNFCPIVAGIEPVGPCNRITFATPTASHSYGGEEILAVVERLVLSDEALSALAEATPRYFAQRNKPTNDNAQPDIAS